MEIDWLMVSRLMDPGLKNGRRPFI
jgi:hypothetical protein